MIMQTDRDGPFRHSLRPFLSGARSLSERRCGLAFIRLILILCASILLPMRAGSVFAQSPPQGLFEYRDTTLGGSVSGEVVRPAVECRKLCEDRSGCVGFDHQSATNVCRLFSEIDGGRESRGFVAATRQALRSYRAADNQVAKPALPSQSRWFHNQSSMILHARPRSDGDSDITIVYDVPKPELIRSGIRQGAILFEGRLTAGTLSGQARLTSSRCGVIRYEVEGMFTSNSAGFFLRGAAPRRDDNCTIVSWSTTGENANLGFQPLN